MRQFISWILLLKFLTAVVRIEGMNVLVQEEISSQKSPPNSDHQRLRGSGTTGHIPIHMYAYSDNPLGSIQNDPNMPDKLDIVQEIEEGMLKVPVKNIILAFWETKSLKNEPIKGEFTGAALTWKLLTPAQRKATKKKMDAAGVKLILSIGGARDTMWMNTEAAAFGKELAKVAKEYLYDGIDFDNENQGVEDIFKFITAAAKAARDEGIKLITCAPQVGHFANNVHFANNAGMDTQSMLFQTYKEKPLFDYVYIQYYNNAAAMMNPTGNSEDLGPSEKDLIEGITLQETGPCQVYDRIKSFMEGEEKKEAKGEAVDVHFDSKTLPSQFVFGRPLMKNDISPRERDDFDDRFVYVEVAKKCDIKGGMMFWKWPEPGNPRKGLDKNGLPFLDARLPTLSERIQKVKYVSEYLDKHLLGKRK